MSHREPLPLSWMRLEIVSGKSIYVERYPDHAKRKWKNVWTNFCALYDDQTQSSAIFPKNLHSWIRPAWIHPSAIIALMVSWSVVRLFRWFPARKNSRCRLADSMRIACCFPLLALLRQVSASSRAQRDTRLYWSWPLHGHIGVLWTVRLRLPTANCCRKILDLTRKLPTDFWPDRHGELLFIDSNSHPRLFRYFGRKQKCPVIRKNRAWLSVQYKGN